MPELKPCPFCGGEAALVVEGDHHGEFYSLGCKDKECYGHHVEYTQTEDWMPKAKAIERWNSRA
jgi:Lar family restriction alleviation protein